MFCVPWQSVFKDPNGSYWYNTDYDAYTLHHHRGNDWQIIDRSEDHITMEFNLNSKYMDSLPTEFWDAYFEDRRLELSEGDFFWDKIKEFEQYWVDVSPKLSVNIQLNVGDTPDLFRNRAHYFFPLGNRLIRNIPVIVKKGECSVEGCEDAQEETIGYFTLDLWEAYVRNGLIQKATKSELAKALKRIEFLKTLPIWNELRFSAGIVPDGDWYYYVATTDPSELGDRQPFWHISEGQAELCFKKT